MAAIESAAAKVATAERGLFIAVCRARADGSGNTWWGYQWAGATWDDIGAALGVSKQAAAKRFGGWRYDELTDQLICERKLS
jgi:hypothetical protein